MKLLMQPSKTKLSGSTGSFATSRRECIAIVAIPDTTNETKVHELTETATSISITHESVEACHRLFFEQNDKIIVKFSRRKNAEKVLLKKKTTKGFSLRSIDIEIGKTFMKESLCCYYKFL